MSEGLQEGSERAQLVPVLFAVGCRKQAEIAGNFQAMAGILQSGEAGGHAAQIGAALKTDGQHSLPDR